MYPIEKPRVIHYNDFGIVIIRFCDDDVNIFLWRCILISTRTLLKNNDIRKAALLSDVRHWQICEKLGISEPTLTRWLRTELPEEKKTANSKCYR